MATQPSIGLAQALARTLENITPLAVEEVSLPEAVDRVAAEALCARVDSPSVDASLKDGYAVIAREVADASANHTVRLTLKGHIAAGLAQNIRLAPGTAVRVLTGAGIPMGADAVVAEEFTTREYDTVVFANFAETGRNVMARGSDVAKGSAVVRAGEGLTPGRLGLLASAGYSHVVAVRRPRVAIMATGSEVVAPGQPLAEGQLYASNMVTLAAWCRRYGMAVSTEIVPDDGETIYNAIKALTQTADALITSGGAWTGDRDLVAGVLQKHGWRQLFHHIRLGPGKATGFGLLADKPIFMLSGGPSSNMMGFLQIALPGLLKLGGHRCTGLPTAQVRLAQDLKGRDSGWTQFVYGTLDCHGDMPAFNACRRRSRLQSMAEATAVVAIPEGKTHMAAGSTIKAQLLT